MQWIQRLERLERKHRRIVNRSNVRAYRKRQRLAGIKRIDLALSRDQLAQLQAFMLPGESFSHAIGRMVSDCHVKR